MINKHTQRHIALENFMLSATGDQTSSAQQRIEPFFPIHSLRIHHPSIRSRDLTRHAKPRHNPTPHPRRREEQPSNTGQHRLRGPRPARRPISCTFLTAVCSASSFQVAKRNNPPHRQARFILVCLDAVLVLIAYCSGYSLISLHKSAVVLGETMVPAPALSLASNKEHRS